MYDPQFDYMFPDLVLAHAELDATVERAYGLPAGMEDAEVVAYLFDLYTAAISQ